MDVFYKTMIYLLFFIFQVAVGSISLYDFSEIKHIAISDSIGEQLSNSDKISRLKGVNFYLFTSFLGLFNLIVISVNILAFNWMIFVIYILVMFAVLLLGMADVLQDEKYNDKLHKKSKFLYAENIIKLFYDKQFREVSLRKMRYNLKNIQNGIKHVFTNRYWLEE